MLQLFTSSERKREGSSFQQGREYQWLVRWKGKFPALLCCWHPAECPLHQKAHWTLLRFYTMRTCQSLLFPSLFPSPNCEFQTAASLPLHPQLMLDQHQELYSLYLRSGWNFNLEAMSFLTANYAVWGREKGSAPLVTINYPDHCPQHPSSSP